MQTSPLFIDNSFAIGDPFDFTVNLPDDAIEVYRNVKSIEIDTFCIPKIQDEIAFIVTISNVDTKLASNNPNVCQSFVAFFDNSLLAPGDFKPCDKIGNRTCIFSPPRDLGHSLRIRISKLDGSKVDSTMTGGEERVFITFTVQKINKR